jgi:hypothetical protein
MTNGSDIFFSVPFLCTKRVALVMNGVASQHSQSQSLLNTSTISDSAGIADHISGAGSTSTSTYQQALQHSPHHDLTSPNDTNITSDCSSSSDLEPSTTTAGVTEALVPKEQGDKVGEGQELVVKEERELLHGTVNGQIELLEHTPEPSVGSGDAEVMVNDSDAQDWIPDADHELKRVKVCQPSYSRHLSKKIIMIMPFYLFNGKIALLLFSNYSLHIIRCTNLSAHGGWIKGQRFALASFKKKQMKPFLSLVQKGIITTSCFQLLFVQTMFISDNKVSSVVCNLPAHAHMNTRRSSWLVLLAPTSNSPSLFRHAHRVDGTGRCRLCTQLSRSRGLCGSMELHP